MIKILVNNQYLELSSDFSIRIKRRHPAFVRDSLGKEFTYPITILKSPTNQKILGFISRQDIIKSTLKIEDVKLTIGSFTALAVLFIYSVNEDGYDCHLKVNQGALDELLKDKTVSSVLPESIVLGSTTEEVLQYANDTLNENSNSPLIFLPIRNHLFYQNHDYFGEKFGSRVLLLFKEEDSPSNNNKLLYINQVNRITGEIKSYQFEYITDDEEILKDNAKIKGHIALDLDDLDSYIKALLASLRDKEYLKDWTISFSRQVGLPFDKMLPYFQGYRGLVIECTDEDWYFANGIPVPLINHPEVYFFNQRSTNQTINHYGYVGKQEFTIDGSKDYSNLLRDKFTNGWPFFHVGFNLVPQLKLKSVLKAIFKSISMSVKGVLMEDKELSNLILYNNYALDEVEELFFAETVYDELRVVRGFDYDLVKPGFQINQKYKANNLQKILLSSKIGAAIKVKDLMIEVLNRLGLWLDFNESNSSFIFRSLNDLLDATKVIDWTDRAGLQMNKDFNALEQIKSISTEYDDELEEEYLKDIDPSKSIFELNKYLDFNPFTGIADAYYYIHSENAYYYFDGNQLKFYSYKKETITLDVEDGQDLSSNIILPYMHQGDDLTNPAYTYYRIANLKTIGTATGEGWVFNYSMDEEVSRRSWRIPFVTEKGSSPAWNQKENKSALRLLFYRGMQKDSEGNNYPMASTDVINYQGKIIAENSLHLHGKYGTYEKHLRRWCRMINKAEVHVFDKKMDIWEALGLKWNQHILINNQKYLMYEYDVVVNMDGIKESQQTMIRL
ncbi:MAG TPA: hypothetical protein VLZ75_03000 [Chitinophagales bacterium]|nr:hypothetical protein [Chitinophagales bacterium]